MKHKNSVIFLRDWAILIQSLPTNKQLIFWDLFMNYPNKECTDVSILPIWNFVKKQLEKMEEKYNENIVKRNKENGSKGGRPKNNIDNQIYTQTQTNPKNPMGYLETQKTLNVNINDNINENINKKEKKEKIIDPYFKDFKTPPENINKQHFYLAKYFHKVFINFHGENKSLSEWKLNDTINNVRKLIEIDLQPVKRLFAFAHYFENEKSNFWIKNTYSLKNIRTKNKQDIYKYDQLSTIIEDFYSKNINIRNDFDIRYNNFLKLIQ
jgi:hypothetical protein